MKPFLDRLSVSEIQINERLIQKTSQLVNETGKEFNQLNDFAGRQQVKLHPETALVPKKTLEISSLCEVVFDITVAPLVKL